MYAFPAPDVFAWRGLFGMRGNAGADRILVGYYRAVESPPLVD
ncbi:MAG TPA: hypothetical protein PL033_09305 [Candidatus Brocadiia bacterium]|nr:hypothetical protein [Candidatus Brocadiia bacterium]